MTTDTKPPPNSQAAEMAVLGSCLRYGAFTDVVDVLRVDDFYDHVNQSIYQAMIDVKASGKEFSPVTIGEACRDKRLDVVAHVVTLWDSCYNRADARNAAEIVKTKAGLRELHRAAHLILREIDAPSTSDAEVIEFAERSIYAIGQKSRRSNMQTESFAAVGNAAADAIDRQVQAAREGKRGATGILAGFIDLDNFTGGFKDGQLIIIAARTSVGKTALGMNLFYNSAMEGIPCVVFSLEQSNAELGERFYSIDTQINSYQLRHGYLTNEELLKVSRARERFEVVKSWLCDTAGATVSQIRCEARRLKSTDKIRMVIVDYLQLIEPDNKRDQRHLQVGDISRQLKMMAKELSVPVIAMAQLNRAGEDRDPRLSDLRESGAIEQDADTVIFLHDPDRHNKQEEGRAKTGPLEVIVAKNRNGPVGTLRLAFKREWTKFFNIAE